MKTKSLFNWKVQLAFGSAIVALLGVGAVSFRGIAVSSESDRWVRHSHEVLENLQSALSAMQDVESSYRGFVITGNEQRLVRYRASIARSHQEETIIRNLTADNPEQQQRLSTLHGLGDQKIQYGETVIGLRRTKGLEATADSMRTGEGLRIMDEYRDVIGKMRDEELGLLDLRDADARRRLGQTEAVLIVGSVLGLLIAAAAGWSVQRDGSGRIFVEEALREAGERFRTLANNIPQLAWMADEKGSIFWYNQRWFDYTGTTLEEMAGWGWQKVHHPDHVQQVVAKISGCFRSGELWEDTFPLRDRDGNYRWFLSQAVPVHDAEGKVLRWFGTNTDITERKKSEEHLVKTVGELKSSEEHLVKTVGELKSSNDELQQFAYVASHDLQEPLRMVASYTQLLAQRYRGRLDSDADEFIAYAVDGSNRMQTLIQDLLTYSRAGTNGQALLKVSSENALEEALTNLRAMIEESGAVVTHDSLPAVTTDGTIAVSHSFLAPIQRIKNESTETFVEQVSAGIQERINSIRLQRSI